MWNAKTDGTLYRAQRMMVEEVNVYIICKYSNWVPRAPPSVRAFRGKRFRFPVFPQLFLERALILKDAVRIGVIITVSAHFLDEVSPHQASWRTQLLCVSTGTSRYTVNLPQERCGRKQVFLTSTVYHMAGPNFLATRQLHLMIFKVSGSATSNI